MNKGSTTAPKARCAKLGSSSKPIWRGVEAIEASDLLRRLIDAFDQVRLSHRRSVRSSLAPAMRNTPMIKPKSLDWADAAPERSMTLPARYFYDPVVFAAERERIFYPA